MLLHRAPNTFGLVIPSTADGTQPSTSFGTSVTPTQNAYGSYATLIAGASLTYDAFEIEICVNNVGISATSRDCLVSLGIDASGGTSFTSVVDLVCGPATPHIGLGGGTWYRFPYFIKAGSSIGAAASVSSANVTAISVFCRVKCQPSRPDSLLVGQYIDSFGVTTASSSGTAVTAGTASEGSWTQLGSALTRPCWYWEYGHGVANSAMALSVNHVDIGIGDASNKNVVLPNQWVITQTIETLSKVPSGAYGVGAIGDLVYGRLQVSANNTGMSLAAYGVGG